MPHTLKDVLPSSARLRSDGHLEIGGADTVDLAREFGTPLFVMCEQTFRERARRYREAYPDADVYYAGKAFLCVAMAKMVAEEGLGLDVASGGELFTALKASFPPERIIFHGNNKSDAEIEMGLKAGVGRIVADSMEDLERADAIAGALGGRAQMMLRVTPGAHARVHPDGAGRLEVRDVGRRRRRARGCEARARPTQHRRHRLPLAHRLEHHRRRGVPPHGGDPVGVLRERP
ncbi:MAG: hypothetical protein E6G46_12030 [Actinobacteria bacterium]|nr:MAG: hypothetical protein E6G46_12030 [Actinomycetota bacterium]